jgi:hypothetical protein
MEEREVHGGIDQVGEGDVQGLGIAMHVEGHHDRHREESFWRRCRSDRAMFWRAHLVAETMGANALGVFGMLHAIRDSLR